MSARSHFTLQSPQRWRKAARASGSMPATAALIDTAAISGAGSSRYPSSTHAMTSGHASEPRRAMRSKAASSMKKARRLASFGDRYSTFTSFLASSATGSMFRMCSSDMEATRADACARNGRGSVNTSARFGDAFGSGNISKTLTRGISSPTPFKGVEVISYNLRRQAAWRSVNLSKNACRSSLHSECVGETSVSEAICDEMSRTCDFTASATTARCSRVIASRIESARAVQYITAVSGETGAGSVMAGVYPDRRNALYAPQVAKANLHNSRRLYGQVTGHFVAEQPTRIGG